MPQARTAGYSLRYAPRPAASLVTLPMFGTPAADCPAAQHPHIDPGLRRAQREP